MHQEPNKNLLLICDLNVFVQAYLFNSGRLLDGPNYSFGKLLIHRTVYDEILHWRKSSFKIKKFTLPLIESMMKKCAEMTSEKPVLTAAEEAKYFRWISGVENSLEEKDRSEITSKADKKYLSLAMKLKGNIATHEGSLRSITRKTIGEACLFSLGDMIKDRNSIGMLAKEELTEGLKNLDQFQEKLMVRDREIVMAIVS